MSLTLTKQALRYSRISGEWPTVLGYQFLQAVQEQLQSLLGEVVAG